MTYKTIEEMYAASLAEASTGQQPEAQPEQPRVTCGNCGADLGPSPQPPIPMVLPCCAACEHLNLPAVASRLEHEADFLEEQGYGNTAREIRSAAEDLLSIQKLQQFNYPEIPDSSPAEQSAPAQTPLQQVQAAEVGDVAVWGGWCAVVKRARRTDGALIWTSGAGGGWPEEHIAAQPDLAIIPASALGQYRIGGNSEQ